MAFYVLIISGRELWLDSLIRETYHLKDRRASNLLARDPYQAIAPTITNIRYLGMGMVNRVPAHHLLYQIGERDVQVWIRDGREPTVQKIVINYHQLPGSPQYTAIFSQWNFNPQFSASLFEFRPPVGVGKINRFSE